MKKIKILICSIFALVLMTGCMKYEVGFNVKSDKEMELAMKIMLSPLLTSEMELTAEDLKASFEESMNQEQSDEMEDEDSTSLEVQNSMFNNVKDYKIETVTETYDDVAWEGIIVTAKIPEEEVGKYVFIDTDGSLVFSLSAEQSNEFTGDIAAEENDTETIQQYKSMGMSMKIMVTMPSTPTTNHGTVEGNTAIIDLLSEEYLLSKDKAIIVYSAGQPVTSGLGFLAEGNTGLYIAIGSGVLVLLILGVGIFIYTKKKNENYYY